MLLFNLVEIDLYKNSITKFDNQISGGWNNMNLSISKFIFLAEDRLYH